MKRKQPVSSEFTESGLLSDPSLGETILTSKIALSMETAFN